MPATTILSDDSDNTASVSSDVAPSAHATAAVSDHSDDNVATVSSKVAPSADATAAGTTIVSDDSDNTVSFGGDDARTAGSRGLSDPAAAITTDTPILRTTATTPSLPVVILPLLMGLEGSQTRQLSSPPARPSPLTTATTHL